ncbi:MAG: hypothetical protein M3Y82_10220 [Verrucomicrobiota bacterium]|nr:hypothetical protein [Verrucomicrobiota bacterium]
MTTNNANAEYFEALMNLTNSKAQAYLKKTQSNYAVALKDATNSIPFAQQFARLFPDLTRSYFSYYVGGAGPTTLVMEALLFDRYELLMTAKVTLDGERRKVKAFDAPEFFIREISVVTVERREGRQPDGSPVVAEILRSGKSGDAQMRFDAARWEKIVEAGGDFSVIGFPLKTNSPAPGFEDYKKQWKSRMEKQQ